MAEKKRGVDGSDDEATDFSFDPGSQVELEVEETCCVTGEPVSAGFCRFPDYKSQTLMVMSKQSMIEHLRNGTSIEKFKEILVKRPGKRVLDEYYSNY